MSSEAQLIEGTSSGEIMPLVALTYLHILFSPTLMLILFCLPILLSGEHNMINIWTRTPGEVEDSTFASRSKGRLYALWIILLCLLPHFTLQYLNSKRC